MYKPDNPMKAGNYHLRWQLSAESKVYYLGHWSEAVNESIIAVTVLHMSKELAVPD